MSHSLWPQGLYSLPGSSVHGILQARILEWVAVLFSRGSSWPRDQTCVSRIAGRFFTIWIPREAIFSICMYKYMHTIIYLCTYKHVCVYICIYIERDMYIRMYVHVCVDRQTHANVCLSFSLTWRRTAEVFLVLLIALCSVPSIGTGIQ